MATREAGTPEGLLNLNNLIFTACNVNIYVQICGNCTFARGVSWLDMSTPNLILHVWKGCVGRQGCLSLAAPSSVRGDFEVTSSVSSLNTKAAKLTQSWYPSIKVHGVTQSVIFMANIVTDCNLLHVLLGRSEKEEKRNGNERETDIEKEGR
jgi:hypothetical protein